MITSLKLERDQRSAADKPGTIRLKILRNRVKSYIATPVRVTSEQWDAAKQRVRGTSRQASAANALLAKTLADATTSVMALEASGALGDADGKDVRRMLLDSAPAAGGVPSAPHHRDLLATYMAKVIDARRGRTREIYEATRRKLQLYLGRDYETLRLSKITPSWLDAWDG